HERRRERQPLLLASGELAHPGLLLVLELDDSHDLDGVEPLLVEAAKQRDRLEDGQLLRELRLLKLDADALAQPAGVFGPRAAEDLDGAAVRPGEPLEHLHRRRLAGAVGTEETEALPG